jgi:hypothetical protein
MGLLKVESWNIIFDCFFIDMHAGTTMVLLSKHAPGLVVGGLGHALECCDQRGLTVLSEAPGDSADGHRLPGSLFVRWDRVAQKFHLGAFTHMGNLDRPGLAGHQGSRMQCHLRDRGDRAIDRLESRGLLLLSGDDDLAWHAVESQYRRGRGAMLAIDDLKLSSLDRGNDDRGETGPRKGPGNAIDVLASLPDDGTLVGGVNDEVGDFEPLQHRGRTGGNRFGLLEALG